MKKWVKECLWAGLLIILPIILVSRNQHGNNNTVDINIYDVYFVIDKYIGLLAIFTALSFPVYLIRAITARFKDTVINYLLMILTIAGLIHEIKPAAEILREMVADFEIARKEAMDL